jgi:hypothetical protein
MVSQISLSFSPRSISYLVIFVSVSILLNYFLKWERFSRLAESISSWGNPTTKGKVNWQKAGIRTLNISSQVLIFILILDEIGLLLEEWNISSGFFLHFRRLLELPGLSQLVFLANLGLVIPATYYLSDGLLDQIKKQNSEYTEKWNGYILFKLKYSLTISFFVLTVTLLFFLIQCLAYNEFGLDEKLDPVFLMIYIIIIFSGMITALFNIIKLSRRIGKEHNPFSHQPWCEKNFMYFTLIIAFMSLAQTMITKVILLLSLVDWAAPAVIKFLGKLAPAMTPKDTQIKSSYERTISELTSASFWHKLNFFFLTTSALVLLILYQFHCSPYPPSNSAFPKTETISGLYMIYMLAYLLIGKGKHIFVQSVLWILATIIILYGTPVLFPSWYLPSIDPPGISAIDAIEKISGIWTSVVFVFVIHMGICIVFISLYYSTELKEFLIRNKYNSVLHFNKFLFLRLFLMEYFYYVLFGFFFLIFSVRNFIQ